MKGTLRTFFVASVVAILAVLCPMNSRGGSVEGVTLFGNELISIDTTTGVGTLIGPLSTNVAPFGLVSVSGKLYTFDSTQSVITQLDPNSGSTLATFSIGLGPVVGQGGLAFQSGSVGFLTTALDPTTLDPVNNLFRFDIASGTSVLVGQTSSTIEALAFGSGGTLYGLGKLDGNLYTIDTTNAAMRLVGNVGISVGGPTGGLTFGPDGMLYATLDDKLYTLDPLTGLATAVGSSDPSLDTGFSSISGLAFASPVPEPASIIAASIGGIAIMAVRLARRRRGHA